MSIRRLLLAGVAGLGVVALLGLNAHRSSAAPGLALGENSFAELRAFIHPRVDELKWQEIPWNATLEEARTEAARTDKPILMWSMDGHPLGCT